MSLFHALRIKCGEAAEWVVPSFKGGSSRLVALHRCTCVDVHAQGSMLLWSSLALRLNFASVANMDRFDSALYGRPSLWSDMAMQPYPSGLAGAPGEGGGHPAVTSGFI